MDSKSWQTRNITEYSKILSRSPQTACEEPKESGIWSILPSWVSPKKKSFNRRISSMTTLEPTNKIPVLQRSTSTLNIQGEPNGSPTPKEAKESTVGNQNPKFSLDEDYEPIMMDHWTPKKQSNPPQHNLTPGDQLFVNDTKLNPKFNDLTFEDLEKVGLPITFSDSSSDASAVDPQTQENSLALLMNENPSSPQKTPTREPKQVEQQSIIEGFDGFRAGSKNSEFDPLIPKDWMMSFDSPSHIARDTTVNNTSSHIPSLLDSLDPIASPKSIVKYSQHDMDALKSKLNLQFENEFALAHSEIADLSKRLSDSEVTTIKLQNTLADWEKAIKTMIEDREREKNEMQAQIQHYGNVHQTLLDAKEQALKDLESSNSKYKALKIELEDQKELTDKYKLDNERLQDDLALSNNRFNALRTHAENKLEEANIEIERTRTQYETELVASRTKISRLELTNNSLKSQLNGKIEENNELLAICDNLEKLLNK